MNLKFIDRVIKANEDTFSEEDVNRLKYFMAYGTIWIAGRKAQLLPKSAIRFRRLRSWKKPWMADRPVFSFAPPKNPEKSFCGDLL